MTEEEKQAETAKAEAEAKAKADKEIADADFEAGIADLSEEEQEAKRAEKEAQNTDNLTDYKAVALREKEAREKAEKALADRRFKDTERKRKVQEDNEEDPIDDDDKPITSRELQRILTENTQQTEKRLAGSHIKKLANGISTSPEEAEAIIEIHANRTFPAHLSLEEQIEEAHAIANRKKLVSTNSELKRALKSKNTASNDSAGTHRDPMEGTATKLSAGDTASYKRAGFNFDTSDKLWKKKLPSGKTLIKNPKTKQTYLSQKQ